ncbi:hypothetical protein Q6348_08065 [Isoptericola sp. b441]|uniref:ARB-07466-like C-terminal domain-containing protein n=1 Tax=Actinotalea lenta TaxID=3064654 RepID=A0ABT9D8D5_9CELL|nr:hypothetical protein [Isoptericola sp. b441]MDO8107150.1 hypothetical protein [Isoptericola sp. b441]
MSGVDSQLGGVKPWVRSAADQLAGAFGLSTVYGYRAGDTADPTTGHSTGLAVDFPTGKAVGDKLVAYVQAHASALGVKYLIWQQRRWTPGGGWTAMAYRPGSKPGYDPNHMRHVHISWNTTAPTGASGGATVTPTAAKTGVSMNPLDALNPTTWGNTIMGAALTLAGVAAGLTLVIMGVSAVVSPKIVKAAGAVL